MQTKFLRLLLAGLAVLLIPCTQPAMAADDDDPPEPISISPDRRFAIRKVSGDDENAPYFKIQERKTGRVVARLPKEGQAPFTEESKFLWSPDSRRLAWNFRSGGRYYTCSLYQWRNGKFSELRSPEIGYDLAAKERARQIKAAKLPADVYQRRIWDTWRIDAWPDSSTAILLYHSIRTSPVGETNDTVDFETWYRFKLTFPEDGRWKVATARLLTEKEAEKLQDE